MQLYGFADRAERELFVQLLTVNGVGPKVALAIVSGSPRRRAAPRDRARGHGALPGDPRDRQEDRRAHRARAEGEDRDAGRRRGAATAPATSTSSRATRSSSSATRCRRRARARRHRRRAAAGGAGAARVEEGRMSTQFLAPVARRRTRRRSSRRSGRAASTSSSGRSASRSSSRSRSTPRRRAARRSTTSCSSGRRASARRASRTSSARSSASASARSPAPRSSARTSPRSSPRSRRATSLFVDEIHRLSRAVEEILYPALEDFRLDIVMGQGAAARTLTLDLPPFTLVGATTRTGLLTTPLRDRFGMTFRLDYYEPGELATIVRRSARILGVEIADDAAEEIARPLARHAAHREPDPAPRARRRAGAARRARSRTAIAREALELLEVDEAGLERIDRELLRTIVEKFDGGPVGLDDARGVARRGAGHDRGRLRAVPAPARLHPAHAARPHDHEARPRAHRRARRADARAAVLWSLASERLRGSECVRLAAPRASVAASHDDLVAGERLSAARRRACDGRRSARVGSSPSLDASVEALRNGSARRRPDALFVPSLSADRAASPQERAGASVHVPLRRDEPRRDEQRHHVEPDVAARDAARRVAVRDPEPGQRRRPAPGADRRPVQLERADDEEDARVGRARARAPEEDAEQRHADRAGDVEARQHGQPREPPADGADRGGRDERGAPAATGASARPLR